MPRRIVIRGTFLGGIPFVVILVGVPVLMAFSIWSYPADTVVFLIRGSGFLIADAILFMIVRRTFVEVSADRVRWFFRRPQRQGDESIGNLQSVTLFRSGALLAFSGGAGGLMLNINDFRKRDIMRVVDTVQQLGVRVDDSGGPIEGLMQILLNRRI